MKTRALEPIGAIEENGQLDQAIVASMFRLQLVYNELDGSARQGIS